MRECLIGDPIPQQMECSLSLHWISSSWQMIDLHKSNIWVHELYVYAINLHQYFGWAPLLTNICNRAVCTTCFHVFFWSCIRFRYIQYNNLLVRTSGSFSSKAGMPVMHSMGVELTMNVSRISPIAAASNTLTCTHVNTLNIPKWRQHKNNSHK